ncbi:IDEAL domain-containing protein [Desmospora profundinema]|uniref:Uncharacterized protein YpiB (UPF0302 family) n=1 Tax=Desmospora profundinema TaxID=1571184 RepID=A0ABU1IPX9_9BACL|nr:IDEAL domain-containing protein [Desmospora profundinema]MDR6225805.1 uncharacterized protein YpiB (UPF0302 family) [Desmospora profundinema]
METLLSRFQDGDWVKGKTINDELFQGYIESINLHQNTAKVRIIQSDNRQMVGKLSISTLDQLKHHEDTALNQEGHLLNFIDMALTTHDKEWFLQLTDSLKELQR